MSVKNKNIWVIVNPVSGTKSKKNIVSLIKSRYESISNLRFFITEYAGHAAEIAEKSKYSNVDIVVAVGGDGTINEVAKSIIDSAVVLSIIPAGSGNGLARSLHISTNFSKAIETIGEGKIRSIDYGRANGHVFLCTCGVGYDAYVSERALHQKKRGILMYAKNMVSVFSKYKPEKYRIKTSDVDITHDAFVVTCANAPQYGNEAYIAPNASMEDGLLHITVLLPIKVYDLPRIGTQMFTNNLTNSKKMIEVISPEVTIYRENEGVMHLDGDAIYEGKEIHVQVIRHGLKVLVPSSYFGQLKPAQKRLKKLMKWI